jgi:hypothetical protein
MAIYRDSLSARVEKNRTVASGTVTLAAGTTTTAVTNLAMARENHVFLTPQTANAAGALATTYVSTRGQRTFTLTHANTVTTDRTFSYIIVAGDV